MIVGLPGGEVVGGRSEAEGAWLVSGVVHSGEAEEEFAMFRNALEQSFLRKGPLADAGFEEAPEIVVVARQGR